MRVAGAVGATVASALAGIAALFLGPEAKLGVIGVVVLALLVAAARTELDARPWRLVAAGAAIILGGLALPGEALPGILAGWVGRSLLLIGAWTAASRAARFQRGRIALDTVIGMVALVAVLLVTLVEPALDSGYVLVLALGTAAPAAASGFAAIGLGWAALGGVSSSALQRSVPTAGALFTVAALLAGRAEQGLDMGGRPLAAAASGAVLLAGAMLFAPREQSIVLDRDGFAAPRLWMTATVVVPAALVSLRASEGTAVSPTMATLTVVGVVLLVVRGLIVARGVADLRRVQRAREARLGSMLETAADVLLLVSPEGRVEYVNGRVVEEWGIEPTRLLGTPLDGLLAQDDRQRFAALLTEARSSDSSVEARLEVRRADGSDGIYAAVVRDRVEDPDVGGLLIAMRDVTAAQRAADREAARAKEHAAVAEVGSAALGGATANHLVDLVLTQLAGAMGLTSCEWFVPTTRPGQLGLAAATGPPAGLVGRHVVDADRSSIAGFVASQRVAVDTPNQHADPRFEVDAHLAPADVGAAVGIPVLVGGALKGVIVGRSPAGRRVDPSEISFAHLMTAVLAMALERRQSEEIAAHRALHDPLTGLGNRRHFLENLEAVIGSPAAERSAVIFCDLDRFKQVNDELGHDAGDVVLVTASERLKHAVRPGDLVCRLGGDEFVALCGQLASADEAMAVAERIRASIDQPIAVGDRLADVSASVGVVLANGSGSAQELLTRADAAMYRSKADGRDAVTLFSDELAEAATERVRSEAAIRSAVDLDQIELRFQPVVDISRGRVVATEALARLIHPTRGLIAPHEFLTVCAEIGKARDLADRVIDRVIAQAAAWTGTPAQPLLVSLNLSAADLAVDSAAATLLRRLEAAGVEPRRVMIEVAASEIRSGVAAAAAGDLRRLAASGVRLAADRVGDSTLDVVGLAEVPWSVAKLTPSVAGDPQATALVAGVARQIAPVVVATAIEDAESLAIATDAGCHWAQGFHFGRPVDASHFETTLGLEAAPRGVPRAGAVQP